MVPNREWSAEGFDHVAVGVSDLSVAKAWYANVLGMTDDFMADEPTFVGDDLAFVRSGNAALALLRIQSGSTTLRGSRAQKGHFALRVSGETFWDMHRLLPSRLRTYQVHPSQSTAILCDDFAVQLSMFFYDPDGNEVEIATWDCERDDTCSRFGSISTESIRGNVNRNRPQPKL